MNVSQGPRHQLKVKIPELFAEPVQVGGNSARQLLMRTQERRVSSAVAPQVLKLADGRDLHVVPDEDTSLDGRLAAKLGSNGRELQHLTTLFPDDPDVVRDSYRGQFRFLNAEETEADTSPGLREPQTGALHAVVAHWTATPEEPATVVMPTGTGKTEAMLALFAHERPTRLLVVVPLALLREQMSEKFARLGLLHELGVVTERVRHPVVGSMNRSFPDSQTARDYLRRCNVVVATPKVLVQGGDEVLRAITGECSHLFIDEAHHAPAQTWTLVRDQFERKRVVQFTATPFRRDRQRIGGRIVYNYPLGRAFEKGYFRPIHYQPVVTVRDQDRAVATSAVQALRQDLEQGHDHVLLARTSTQNEADELLAIYNELADDLGPRVLHQRIGKRQRQQVFRDIESRAVRIVLCVDMFGEGFDFPNLKVAALHSPQRSLGPTLQFVGRFARAGEDVGAVTVVAPRPEPGYDESLRRLYAENADWNAIITELSVNEVAEERKTDEFEARFNPQEPAVAQQSLEPRMNTVVYTTQTPDWNPSGVHDLVVEEDFVTDGVIINAIDGVLWFVTKHIYPVQWAVGNTLEDVSYHLYIVYWDSTRRLLYIYSSDKSGVHERLAQAVCPDAELVKGEAVYRAMHGLNRPVPVNVGVLDQRSRSRRFSLHSGSNVAEGFSEGEASTKTQTNVFVTGYEDGERRTVGTSLKGRVWSYRPATSIKEWVDWCDHVGPKLADKTIEPTHIKDGFIRPRLLESRPQLTPLSLGWPEDVYRDLPDTLVVRWDDHQWPLIDCDLRLNDHSREGTIGFQLCSPERSSSYEVKFDQEGMTVRPTNCRAELLRRDDAQPLRDYLANAGITIFCEDDAVIEPPGVLLKPDVEREPFDRDRLTVLDWRGIDIRKESRGAVPRTESVQHRTYEHIIGLSDWDLVIDDDGSGEVADLVAIRSDYTTLYVLLVHCKYSSRTNPGSRVEDLYELCGQAQKSVEWRRQPDKMLRRLKEHQPKAELRDSGGILKGSVEELLALEDRIHLLGRNFGILLVQPGLSRQAAGPPVLDLLASTEGYVMETGNSTFSIACSA